MSDVGQVRATFRTFQATFGIFLQKNRKRNKNTPSKNPKITKNGQKYQIRHILENLNQDLWLLRKLCLNEYVWAS